jgi:hypothetical protein
LYEEKEAARLTVDYQKRGVMKAEEFPRPVLELDMGEE